MSFPNHFIGTVLGYSPHTGEVTITLNGGNGTIDARSLIVRGDASITGTTRTSNLFVSHSSTLHDVLITGNLTVNGSSTVIKNSLRVDGGATFKGRVSFPGIVDVEKLDAQTASLINTDTIDLRLIDKEIGYEMIIPNLPVGVIDYFKATQVNLKNNSLVATLMTDIDAVYTVSILTAFRRFDGGGGSSQQMFHVKNIGGLVGVSTSANNPIASSGEILVVLTTQVSGANVLFLSNVNNGDISVRFEVLRVF